MAKKLVIHAIFWDKTFSRNICPCKICDKFHVWMLCTSCLLPNCSHQSPGSCPPTPSALAGVPTPAPAPAWSPTPSPAPSLAPSPSPAPALTPSPAPSTALVRELGAVPWAVRQSRHRKQVTGTSAMLSQIYQQRFCSNIESIV